MAIAGSRAGKKAMNIATAGSSRAGAAMFALAIWDEQRQRLFLARENGHCLHTLWPGNPLAAARHEVIDFCDRLPV
jgi:hypothetical protein